MQLMDLRTFLRSVFNYALKITIFVNTWILGQICENTFKKSKNPSPFFSKTLGSKNSFTLTENNFRF